MHAALVCAILHCLYCILLYYSEVAAIAFGSVGGHIATWDLDTMSVQVGMVYPNMCTAE